MRVRVATIRVLVGVEQLAVPDAHRILMLDNHTRDMDLVCVSMC